MEKSPDAFRTISEVADHLDTPAHVLRFWESRFPQIRPVKRAGGRRYYRPSDMALLSGIRRLLHDEGMTIRGVQKILREQGVRFVAALAGDADLMAPEMDVTDAPALTAAPGAPVADGTEARLGTASADASVSTAPTQLALFEATDAVPSQADTAMTVLATLRSLSPGALSSRRAAIAPLAERLRTLCGAVEARAQDAMR